MKPVILAAAFLAVGATAGYVAFSATNAGESGHGHDSDVTALRTQVDALTKEVQGMKRMLSETPASAAGAPTAMRENIAPAKTTDQAVAANEVSATATDRNAIFALIKEEREMRDKERQDKTKQQIKSGVQKRIEATAQQLGLPEESTKNIVAMWLKSLDREEEVRKAYPIDGFNDPMAEKRRLEIDAVREDRDKEVASLVPSDKQDEWDRSTRFLRRAGGMMDMTGGGGPFGGDFNPFDFGGGRGPGQWAGGGPGGGGQGGFTNGGNNNNNGGGARRGNRGGGGAPASAAPPQGKGN